MKRQNSYNANRRYIVDENDIDKAVAAAVKMKEDIHCLMALTWTPKDKLAETCTKRQNNNKGGSRGTKPRRWSKSELEKVGPTLVDDR